MREIGENYDNENHSQKDSLEITRRRGGHTHKVQKPVNTIVFRIGTQI